jgi:hypothetical protein
MIMKIIEWTKKQQQAWSEWVISRPPVVQELCRQFPPDRLYRLKPTLQRVTIISYCENGTITVDVSRKYNPTMLLFDRRVFGISPDQLEETK